MLPSIKVKPCANHVSDGFRVMCLLMLWVVFIVWISWLFAGGPLKRKGHWNMENITYIFKASLKIFRYALLLLWFLLLFFPLNYINLYLKALCSVYFLEKITWLYVYCKYIKYTIFVFNMTVSVIYHISLSQFKYQF